MSKNNSTSNQDTELSTLVSTHVNNLDDKGKLQLPEDMPDWQKAVIRSEKRTRDAQAELSNSQTEVRGLKAENGVLKDTALTVVPDDFQLSDADLTEIEDLKKTNPEAYRLRVNKLEEDAKTHQTKAIADLTTKAREDAQTTHQATNRVSVLAEFRIANPTLIITDEVLAYDVPPRLLEGVNKGEYTYGEFLGKVKTYIESGTTVGEGNTGDPHNIQKMNGTQTPGKKAALKAGQSDYKKMTF